MLASLENKFPLKLISNQWKPRGRVFISYRRTGGTDLAGRVRDNLEARGFSTFMDVNNLESGPYPEALMKEIDAASDFILILTANALDRCRNHDDWLRREFTHARAAGKNIIPIVATGFEFPSSLPEDLTDIRMLQHHGANSDLFSDSMNRLAKRLRAEPRRFPWVLWMFLILGIAVAFVQPKPGPRERDTQELLRRIIELQERSLEIQSEFIILRERGPSNQKMMPPDLEEKSRNLRKSLEVIRREVVTYQSRYGPLPQEILRRTNVLEKSESILDRPFDFIWAEMPATTFLPKSNPLPPIRANLIGHTGRVLTMQFSADGQLLATGGEDKTVKIWNIPDGTLRTTLRGFRSASQAVGFSGDARMLAWGGDGGQELAVKVWNFTSGREQAAFVMTMSTWPSRVYSVVFSPKNDYLAAGSSGPLGVWKLDQTNQFYSLPWQEVFPSYISSLAFSPDGETLAAECHGGEMSNIAEAVRLWNIRESKLGDLLIGSNEGRSGLSHDDVRSAVAYTPDGTRVIRVTKGAERFSVTLQRRGRQSGNLKIWSLSARTQPTSYEVPFGNAYALAIQTNENILVAAVWGKSERPDFQDTVDKSLLSLWDTTRRIRWEIRTGHQGPVVSVTLSSDGKLAATAGGEDNLVRIWNVDDAIAIAAVQHQKDRDKLIELCEKTLDSIGRNSPRGFDPESARQWYREELRQHPEIRDAKELSEIADRRANRNVSQFLSTLTQSVSP